jgi:hypothetical protein
MCCHCCCCICCILTYLALFLSTRHHSIWACRGTDTRGIIWRDEIDGRRRCATENAPIFWNMCCYCCCCICCISRSDRKCNQYLARMNQNLGPNQCKTARYGNSIRMSERVIQRKLRLYTTPRFVWVTRYNKSCHRVPEGVGRRRYHSSSGSSRGGYIGRHLGPRAVCGGENSPRAASQWTRKGRLAEIGGVRVIGTIGWEVCVPGIRGNKMVRSR